MDSDLRATVTTIDPKSPVAPIARAALLQYDRKRKELIASAQQMHRTDQDPIWQSIQPVERLLVGDLGGARAVLPMQIPGVFMDPPNVAGTHDIDLAIAAQILRQTGSAARADALLAARLSANSQQARQGKDPQALAGRGYILAAANRTNEALDKFERAYAAGWRLPIEFDYFIRSEDFPFMTAVAATPRWRRLMKSACEGHGDHAGPREDDRTGRTGTAPRRATPLASPCRESRLNSRSPPRPGGVVDRQATIPSVRAIRRLGVDMFMGKIRSVPAMLLGWLRRHQLLHRGFGGCSLLTPAVTPAPIEIIIDTDIGDDIDDSFALAWALANPRFDVVAVTSAWGDTTLRDRMIRRILSTMGRDGVPIGHGLETRNRTVFTQRRWAEAGALPAPVPTDAAALIAEKIRRSPGDIVLVALAPLTNIGALIDRDPATFRKLKAVVVMSGSIGRGYNSGNGAVPGSPPSAEYNAAMDPASLRKLLGSGVPVHSLSARIRPRSSSRKSSATGCSAMAARSAKCSRRSIINGGSTTNGGKARRHCSTRCRSPGCSIRRFARCNRCGSRSRTTGGPGRRRGRRTARSAWRFAIGK